MKTDAFDHFVVTSVYAVCLGASWYGVAVSGPIMYRHARAFVKQVKPAIETSFQAAENSN